MVPRRPHGLDVWEKNIFCPCPCLTRKICMKLVKTAVDGPECPVAVVL
jgi:hypothetical protein